jgi:hypothetical protein
MTSGELAESSGGTEVNEPLSESEAGSDARSVVGRLSIVPMKRGESRVTGQPTTELGRGRQSAKMVRKREKARCVKARVGGTVP